MITQNGKLCTKNCVRYYRKSGNSNIFQCLDENDNCGGNEYLQGNECVSSCRYYTAQDGINVCVAACIGPYKYELEGEGSSLCTKQCPHYVDKNSKCVSQCDSMLFKADLLNNYCVDECESGTYQVSLPGGLKRCTQSCWMYGMIVESEDNAICMALEQCASGVLKSLGFAEYVCVRDCSEGQYTLEDYVLG